jgi:hypothetical protein
LWGNRGHMERVRPGRNCFARQLLLLYYPLKQLKLKQLISNELITLIFGPVVFP